MQTLPTREHGRQEETEAVWRQPYVSPVTTTCPVMVRTLLAQQAQDGVATSASASHPLHLTLIASSSNHLAILGSPALGGSLTPLPYLPQTQTCSTSPTRKVTIITRHLTSRSAQIKGHREMPSVSCEHASCHFSTE